MTSSRPSQGGSYSTDQIALKLYGRTIDRLQQIKWDLERGQPVDVAAVMTWGLRKVAVFETSGFPKLAQQIKEILRVLPVDTPQRIE